MRLRLSTKIVYRRTVADIQRKLFKWSKRNVISRRFHAKDDKETIDTWRLDLDKILQVVNVSSAA